MHFNTPVERAVATYRADWIRVQFDSPRFAVVNPETLGAQTDGDFQFRYLDISSVDAGSVSWNAVPIIRFADAPSRARRVVRNGDVLLCTVRPLLGSHAFASCDFRGPIVCSTGFAVIRAAAGMKPEFLKYLPFAEQVTRQMVAWQCGTNYPAVNERDIRQLTIPAPSPGEQAAIARILDSVDTAIERARDAIRLAAQFKNALVQEFFYAALGVTAYADRPSRKLPNGWVLSPMEALIVGEPKNGVSPKCSSQPPGSPTFSIAAIRGGRVDLANGENLKYAEVHPKVLDKFRISKGDILIVRGNANPDLVGKAGRVTDFPDDCIYPDIAKRVILRDSGDHRLLPEFAVFAWNHPIVHNQILRRAKTSNGTLKINNRDVKQIVVPVPPIERQEEIVSLTLAADRMLDALEAKRFALTALKKSLMHDLLTGTVRVTDCDFTSSP
ncbi:restriction endonuclease subunit S [uncultured Thiodictyon sp.]|nr:restriction endonuclease subunit S [uncultured Thiodictyon sp.]